MRRSARLVFVMLALALTFSGCSGISGSPGVEKTTWILESLGDGSVQANSYGYSMPFLMLSDGQVSGTLAVNSVNGSYELSGDSISFSQLASTEMAGPPEAMEQETRFLAALEAAAHVEVQDATLIISDEDGVVVLRLTEAVEG